MNDLTKLLSEKIIFCPNLIGPCKFNLKNFCVLFEGSIDNHGVMDKCFNDKKRRQNGRFKKKD